MIKNNNCLFCIVITLLAFSPLLGLAQQNVGIGTTTPDASAALEVESSDKGFLPPRMSVTEILNITSPAEGLVVYNSDSEELYVFNGTDWVNMSGRVIDHLLIQEKLDNGDTPKQIFDSGTSLSMIYGKTYQGGYIAYLDTSTGTGLISATTNQGSTAEWGCSSLIIDGADGTAIGTGQQNTIDILAGCSTLGIAARLCNDYSVSVNEITYDDWFLPSADELGQLYVNLKAHDLGNFQNFAYWSSTESATRFFPFAIVAQFTSGLNGIELTENKQNMYLVRAVRTF